MRFAFLALLVFSACPKEQPREAVGPVSIALPEGFKLDANRTSQLASKSPLEGQTKVWANSATRMQLALTLARLPHQAEWDKVSNQVLLTEMVTQELAAGEKAGLKTVDWKREWQGAALHYTLEGDMNGQLATSNHTALWVDAKGDCWHASAVCTAAPAQRAECTKIVGSVRFDVDAGVGP